MPIQPLSKLGPSGLTRRQEKARQARQDAKARRACVEAVWSRAQGHCEWFDAEYGVRCNRFLQPSGTFYRAIGQVDEIVSRGQGGDPTDPANCRLLCFQHHFSGPSGAHRQSERRTA